VLAEELKGIRQARNENQADFATWLNSQLDRRYTKAQISRWECGSDPIPSVLEVLLREKTPVPGKPSLTTTILSVANQKGGVGKTTTAVNISYGLAKKGYRVLMIDVDPQANLTIHVGQNPFSLDREKKTLYYALFQKNEPAEGTNAHQGIFDAEEPEFSLSEFIIPASESVPLFLVPSSISLASADMELLSEPGADRVLKEALRSVSKDFDFIVLDCPPQFGYLTTNALTASHLTLIPVQCELLAQVGIPLLFNTISKIRRRGNRNLEVLGILPTMANLRQTEDRNVLKAIKDTWGDKITVFPSVARSTVYAQSTAAGRPTAEFAPNAAGMEAYHAVVDSLISHARRRTDADPLASEEDVHGA